DPVGQVGRCRFAGNVAGLRRVRVPRPVPVARHCRARQARVGPVAAEDLWTALERGLPRGSPRALMNLGPAAVPQAASALEGSFSPLERAHLPLPVALLEVISAPTGFPVRRMPVISPSLAQIASVDPDVL